MSHAKGFTLTEMMVTIALAAIVMALAAPSLQGIIENNRLSSTTNSLITALNLARSEAITRGMRVSVCKAAAHESSQESGKYVLDDPLACDRETCDPATGDHCWERGWLVFSDSDRNNMVDDDGDSSLCEAGEDCVIRVYDVLPSNMTLRANIRIKDRVAFKSDGSVAGSNGTFSICFGMNGKNYRQIKLNNIAGRARLMSCNPASPDWDDCTPCATP